MARSLLSFQSLFCAFCLVAPPVMLMAPKGVVPVLLALAAALLLAYRQDPRPLRRPDGKLVLLTLLLLLWAASASLWSLESSRALVLALRLSVVLAAGFWLLTCATALREDEKRRITRFLSAGFALAVAILVFEVTLGDPLGQWLNDLGVMRRLEPYRFNRGSTYLAILVWPLAAALWPRLGPKALLVPAALLLLFLPLYSLSAVVSMACSLAVAALALLYLRTARLLLTAGVLVAILAAPILTLGIDRSALDQLDFLTGTALHRLHFWSFVGERIAEAPAFGWGFDASRSIPSGDTVRFTPDQRDVIPLHPHNAGLQVWLELGLVGAALLAGLTWTLLRGLAGLPRIDQALGLAMFAGAFVIASVSYGLWQNQWVAALLVCALAFQLCRSGEDARGPASSSPDPRG